MDRIIERSLSSRSQLQDDEELCPPWWPRLLWDLHYWPRPKGWPGPGPVNYPPIIEEMMALLHT
jgi:hypothetical protein